jgi:hypothetical protein
MDRTYLDVPPADEADVQALGAPWDHKSMCWHVDPDEDLARFSEWMPDDAADEEYTITSDQGYVASTTIACCKCHSKIEVICIARRRARSNSHLSSDGFS